MVVLLDANSAPQQERAAFNVPYAPIPQKVVHTVDPTEAALGLWEGPLQLTGSWRRWQVIFVVRNDQKAAWFYDMGPITPNDADAIRIPGFVDRGNGKYDVVETVERLRHFADIMRNDTREAPEPTDLVGGYFRAIEEYNLRRAGGYRSTFGHNGATIRA